MKLLAIDTASAQCSVALLVDDALTFRGVATARDHAQLVLPLVDELLAEAGFGLGALDGIAFGRGPGSFTGVRIAAAVTQGLAAAVDLPVLPVSDLRALAEQARSMVAPSVEPAALLACMDARMGEVYWALYAHSPLAVGEALLGERVSGPDALLAALPGVPPILAAAGMGLGAHVVLAAAPGVAGAKCLPGAEPHAREIAWLAQADLHRGAAWLDAAAAQPVYLRDQIAQIPCKNRPL